MPTAFTEALIARKLDFPTFAMLCTRGMSIAGPLHDEPLDAPIPRRFKPDTYYEDDLKKTKRELKRLEGLSKTARLAAANRQIEKQLDGWKKDAGEMSTNTTELKNMLAKVMTWEPPTEKHVGLKRFMVQQLEATLESETSEFANRQIRYLKSLSAEAMWQIILDGARAHVANAEESWQSEVERTSERNRWFDELRKSLKGRAGRKRPLPKGLKAATSRSSDKLRREMAEPDIKTSGGTNTVVGKTGNETGETPYRYPEIGLKRRILRLVGVGRIDFATRPCIVPPLPRSGGGYEKFNVF